MSKFHLIKINDNEYKVRDVRISNFAKKHRVAPPELKDAIINNKETLNINYIRYINKRIHFWIDNSLIDFATDEDIEKFVEKNVNECKNNLEL